MSASTAGNGTSPASSTSNQCSSTGRSRDLMIGSSPAERTAAARSSAPSCPLNRPTEIWPLLASTAASRMPALGQSLQCARARIGVAQVVDVDPVAVGGLAGADALARLEAARAQRRAHRHGRLAVDERPEARAAQPASRGRR